MCLEDDVERLALGASGDELQTAPLLSHGKDADSRAADVVQFTGRHNKGLKVFEIDATGQGVTEAAVAFDAATRRRQAGRQPQTNGTDDFMVEITFQYVLQHDAVIGFVF